MLSFSDYKDKISQSVHYHIENNIPFAENIYRVHSEEFYKLFREARELYNEGLLTELTSWDKTLLETDIGEFGDYENQKRGAFVHDYADYEQGITSDFHDLFIDLIKKSCSKLKIKEVDVLQGRSFLQLPTNIKKEDVDSPHTDMIFKHFVMLYYVCDSDGDTVIYNEKKISEKGLTVQKKISPKQGRVVLFDGAYYHTAEQPNNNIRCIVNYDLIELSVDSHI